MSLGNASLIRRLLPPLALTAAVMGMALAKPALAQSSRADGPWSGYAQCQVTVQGPGYSDQQTHTWQLTGGQPAVQGAIHIHTATWTSTGSGSFTKTAGGQTQTGQWTRSVQSMSAPIGIFLRASDGTLIIKAWHSQLRSSGGVTGTLQVSDGTRQSTSRLALEAFEWAFPAIESVGTSTALQGSKTENVSGSVGPMQPAGSTVTSSCSWQFSAGSNGAAPPPPDSATNPPPPGSTTPGSTQPPSSNGSATAPQNPPSSSPPTGPATPGTPPSTGTGTPPPSNTGPPDSTNPGSTGRGSSTGQTQTGSGSTSQPGEASSGSQRSPAPQLLRVEPASAEQNTTTTQIALTAQGTHWQGGTTKLDFGPGITPQGEPIFTPSTAHVVIAVAPDAALGPRRVTVTTPLATGTETVGLPNAFTVTPSLTVTLLGPVVASIVPVISGASPSGGSQGQQNLTVTLTGKLTHFAQGSTQADFGSGVSVTSLTINSPTSATAVVNIDQAATAGAHDIKLTSGTEVAALAQGFSVGITPTVTPLVLTPSLPAITSVNPNIGFRSAVPEPQITITAQGTHFAQGKTHADFGAAVELGSITVNSETSVTVSVRVLSTAVAGPRTVQVWTDSNPTRLKMENGFTVKNRSGKYRILLNGFQVNHETLDNVSQADGQHDEVYAAAEVEVIDLSTKQITYAHLAKTAVHGDNNGLADRVLAGTATDHGGIRTGDVVPAGEDPAMSTRPAATSFPQTFPLLLWEGTLSERTEAVVVRPTLWEWDGWDRTWEGWKSRVTSASLRDRELSRILTHVRPFDIASWRDENWAELCVSVPDPSAECTPGHDRPIGLDACSTILFVATCSWQDRFVSVTFDGAEKALKNPYQATDIPPWVVKINLADESNLFNGNYDLYIRVERISLDQ